ncbi:hypothetical protein [Marinobacter caseinilyticus]|nr:hypothetical protein [Marinobacter caseinilyticus]
MADANWPKVFEIRQVVLKITTFDKHRLAVMTALDADINRSTVKVGSDLL